MIDKSIFDLLDASPEDEARARANGFATYAEFRRHMEERDRRALEVAAANVIAAQVREVEDFRRMAGPARTHGPASIADILG